ncbi:MAG: phage tail protein, partial [Legionella sp.]|nr:phage tail protein [Legionella sp.]
MARIVHYDNPFDPLQRREHRVRKPATVRRLLRQRGLRRHTSVRRLAQFGNRRVREFNRPTVCLLNGKPLLRAHWSRTVVGAGDTLTFVTSLTGGGGKNPLAIVLAIAVAVAAPYLAGLVAPALAGALAISTGLATSIATAGIGIVLAAAAGGLMSLFAGPAPPPAQASFASSTATAAAGSAPVSPTFSIGAQGNTARLEQPIPELVGRHVVYPDFAMLPYSRFVDNEQYVHSLLVPTRGSMEIEQTRIGETPIESFEEITTEQREPGELGDPEICDARWLTCRDLATVLLPDSSESSPWKGPFAANPANTVVDTIEVDLVAPGGLYKYNSSGGFDGKSVTVEIEAQLIDAAGDPVGDPDTWEAVDTEVKAAATQTAQRWTETYELSPGRWRVRLRRTDAKDFDATARHDIQWVGLRGRLTTERRFPGVTTVAVRMKATGDLNNQTSRQVNIIGTRKLPTWDAEAGTMTETLAATRNPCDVFAHVARTWNPDHKIDLAGLYAHKATFAADDWTFDYVFDSARPTREVLKMVARAVGGVEVEQGGRICLVLDRANAAAAMVFTPRNIRKGSLNIDYAMIDEQTADGVRGSYIDTNAWKPVTVTVAFDDSAQKNVQRVGTEGITNREQLRFVLWKDVRENRYRRRAVSLGSEMEGLTLLYGDSLAVSHDLPRWGQAAEVIAWDAGTRTMTLSEAMEFTEGATHYIALRNRVGLLAGPFEATAGSAADRIVVGAGELPDILTGGDRERTIVQFGPGETYARRLKVILVDPQDEHTADIVACDDDPRMYEPLPDEDAPPTGSPSAPLDIHVTANVANLNLRTLANAHGYTTNTIQSVTITIDPGVEVTTVIRGTWPTGFKPTLVNLGTISGVHGGPGAPGGTALNCSSGPITVDNTGAILRGGGGGGGHGGGGGKGGDAYFEYTTSGEFGGFTTTHIGDGGPGGGGGGGGAGGGGGGGGG